MKYLTHVQQDNVNYIEDLYAKFLQHPNELESDWKHFFEGVEFSQRLNQSTGFSEKEMGVHNLIHAYRNYGYLEADLNPLTTKTDKTNYLNFPFSPKGELLLSRFGLEERDLETSFKMGSLIGKPDSKLKDILVSLKSWYCGQIAIQCAEALPSVRKWFIEEFEKPKPQFSREQKVNLLQSLTRTEALEKFLHTRFVGKKRFSIEGADTMILMLEEMAERATTSGVEEVVIGMAHRGRINVLANFMGKALEIIFAEFDEYRPEGKEWDNIEGDVKYHLGFNSIKETVNGPCHISLAFNPSHLEAVCPVVSGITRAKQRRRQDTEFRKKVVPILIHGDASVVGQGVVAETLQLSRLEGYQVGGTIHIVIDNQIAFTATPRSTRSSVYASDIFKLLQTPVIHVNSDSPESCVQAMELALRYRQASGRDIVINLICYRRHGHNEGDEPSFTQPLMYERIKTHPTVREIYGRELITQGLIDEDFFNSIYKQQIDTLTTKLSESRKNRPKLENRGYKGLWYGLRRGSKTDLEKSINTSVDEKKLIEIGTLLTTIPKNFNPHPKISKLLENRQQMLQVQKIDWGFAELLAYGTLINEGTKVRLSGQDSARGTFSHRHSILYDIINNKSYSPLNFINSELKKPYCCYDSPLSEMAVLGFEYGNSISDPWYLNIWEAQFGDFANGAQIIIDQFITSGEIKWLRSSGITLLLPHGYEGQGPEHSSARLERFLQLCGQENIQVCQPSTPAQLFHVLRRQIKRDFRKPLIIMTPKSLLRHPKVISSITEFSQNNFKEVLTEPIQEPKKIKTALFCSGKIYYDLLDANEKRQIHDNSTVLIRLEQIYPFPEKLITEILKNFPNLEQIAWTQEEPKNMGAFNFIYPYFIAIKNQIGLNKNEIVYIGRAERASTATGSSLVHKKTQQQIIETCLKL